MENYNEVEAFEQRPLSVPNPKRSIVGGEASYPETESSLERSFFPQNSLSFADKLSKKFFLSTKWLESQPMLPYMIQVMSPVQLISSLQHTGLEDCVEIIEHVKGAPLRSVLDLDTWSFNKDHSARGLNFGSLIRWLELWLMISPSFAVERLLDLDDDTLVLWLSTLFEIHPDGLDNTKLVPNLDDFLKSPEGRFFIKPKEDDADAFEILKPVVDALYGFDSGLASALFGHAAMRISSETLEDAARFREARLADFGMTSWQEAVSSLRFRSPAKVVESIKHTLISTQNANQKKGQWNSVAWAPTQDFDALENIQKEMKDSDPDLVFEQVLSILGKESTVALLQSSDLRPETVLDDPQIMEEAAQKIYARCKKLLGVLAAGSTESAMSVGPQISSFKITGASFDGSSPGDSQESTSRNEIELSQSAENVELLMIDKVLESYQNFNPDALIGVESIFYSISNTIISAEYANQVSPEGLALSLSHVRGLLNVGLEFALSSADLEVIEWIKSNEESQENSQIEKAVSVFDKIGPQNLFYLGLAFVREHCSNTFANLDNVSSLVKKINRELRDVVGEVDHKLEIPKIGFRSLYTLQRESQLTLALERISDDLDQDNLLVLRSLSRRLPMFVSGLLDASSGTKKVIPKPRPFETLRDVKWIEHYGHTLAWHLKNLGVSHD